MQVQAERSYDVMLQGRAFFDLTFVFATRERPPELGQEVFSDDFGFGPGGIFNIVSALSALEARVGWLTQLGNDIFSRFLAEHMEALGLSMALTEHVDEPLPVVTAGVSFPHDRLFLSYSAPLPVEHPHPQITEELLDRFRPRVLFTYGEVGIDIMRAARARGIAVVVDTFWKPEHLHSPYLREMLAHVDVFCPNLSEALEMTGAGGPHEAVDAISEWCRCGAIKCGADGCVAWDGSERYDVPAIPVQARETTGAGDSFNAGMIFGLLRGYDFETCLRCANITGGLSTLVVGGTRTGVTPGAVEEWLRRLEPAGRHVEVEGGVR